MAKETQLYDILGVCGSFIRQQLVAMTIFNTNSHFAGET